jgi:hypothetical protein
MKKLISILAPVALATIITSTASAEEHVVDAQADAHEPTPAESMRSRVNMSLLAGHGFKDAFKTGFGGRLGYTVSNGLYVGGTFIYHTGTSEGLAQGNVWYGGAEVGYDVAAGPFVIRPYAGSGIASVYVKVTVPDIGTIRGGTVEASESRFAFWPGATLLFPFEQGSAYVGIDSKMIVVADASAFTTYGTFGMTF